jgi:DNA-binding transcriptional LysR family regulator
MDTIQNIKAFLLVARTGSITAAARQLGVVPSLSASTGWRTRCA